MTKQIANETLAIIEQGFYLSDSGIKVSIKQDIDKAVRGTVLYRAGCFSDRPLRSAAGKNSFDQKIEVTSEGTTDAARRLLLSEGKEHVAALNFASAKNPGGGFLGGAKAQEEDLCRCSALYPCLLTQKDYYEENRANSSMLYLDHIIYSPEVPFFRDDSLKLLDCPFNLSIITAPAPNAGEFLRREESQAEAALKLKETVEMRAGLVLKIAVEQRHKNLILGAWGCGVFRNDPELVADIFAAHLASPEFSGAFELVLFAIYDRSPEQKTLKAFSTRFV